jgi:hypothetical protein
MSEPQRHSQESAFCALILSLIAFTTNEVYAEQLLLSMSGCGL